MAIYQRTRICERSAVGLVMSDDFNIGCIAGCGRIRISRGRGNCSSCYNKLKKLVQAGKTTWEKLIEQGKALPIEGHGAKLKRIMRRLFG